jgi:hypothetical protein
VDANERKQTISKINQLFTTKFTGLGYGDPDVWVAAPGKRDLQV